MQRTSQYLCKDIIQNSSNHKVTFERKTSKLWENLESLDKDEVCRRMKMRIAKHSSVENWKTDLKMGGKNFGEMDRMNFGVGKMKNWW